mgnify:CR=1 FL=1
MKINFKGAARTVTGSKHLITTWSGKNILLDCGLFQGEDAKRKSYNKKAAEIALERSLKFMEKNYD